MKFGGLKQKQTSGPSNIPVWALKDGAPVLTEHFCFLLYYFLNETLFHPN